MKGLTLRSALFVASIGLLLLSGSFALQLQGYLKGAGASPSAVAVAPTTSGAEVPIAVPPLSSYTETLLRPLFFEGRTYPQEAARTTIDTSAAPVGPRSQSSEGPVPPDSMTLLGVLVIGGRARALIHSGESPAEWHEVGARIGDWTVAGITAEQVSLRNRRQTAVLDLHKFPTTYSQPRSR